MDLKNYIFSLLLLVACTGASFAQSDPFVRYPSLSPDGSKISFSYQGDIWKMPASGGQAVRMTIHEAYESKPLWSPDGKYIAFEGERYGNSDLYVMDARGGNPKRLTFHSAGDRIGGWMPGNKIMFTTGRLFADVEWESEIQTISAKGGTPERYFDAIGKNPVVSPDGRFIAYVTGAAKVFRKRYRGPANRDIWVYDTQNKAFNKITAFAGADMQPDWGADSRTLFFISEADGTHNLYRTQISDEGKPEGATKQLTKFKDDGVRHFDVSANGKKVILEADTHIYLMNVEDGTPKPVKINLIEDERFDPVEYKTFTNNLRSFAISPNTKLIAFVVRGEIFVKKNDKESSRSVRITKSPYFERDVEWLNDSTLIFSSDRHGQYDLFLARSSNKEETNMYKSLKHEIVRLTSTGEDERLRSVSPDGKRIAFERGSGGFLTASVTDGKITDEVTLLKGWATPGAISWSPDSKWLAYSMEDLNFNEEVYIHAADASKDPVNISMHPRIDSNPVWSPDGSKLAFTSARNNGDMDVWFVWLRREDWEKTRFDWEEQDDEPKAPKKPKKDPKKEDKEGDDSKKDKKKGGKEDDTEPIQIDFEDIHERLQQVTSLPANESELAVSKDGEKFFFVGNRPGREFYKADMDLYSIKWDGTELKRLTQGGTNPYGITLGPKGKNLYMVSRGSLSSMSIASGKTERLPFRASMEINYPEEMSQVFDEAWRTLNEGFYDPDFHGVNWKKLGDKYKTWAMKASGKRDFGDVFNMMLGELNASHLGLYSGDRAETQRERTGRLGVELKPLAEGAEVTHVVKYSPAWRVKSRLNVGDIIMSVNGEPVKADKNFYRMLVNTSGQKILLEVKSKEGAAREVIIEPKSNLGRELYEEWVDEQKRQVDEFSDGRLGYIHIEGMNWGSFERFERELVASGHGKEGIVIDVRFNGGGWTTDYLMAVLNVRQHAYTVPRGAAEKLSDHKKFSECYPYGERLPMAALTKPSVALCNEYSYSNAEIFSHAYKHLGHGTLVGKPTFGAVISTGGRSLLDGSFVRLPFRGWFVKETQENMENGPAVPDIVLENPQDVKGSGTDVQLKRAVEELLKEVDNKKLNKK